MIFLDHITVQTQVKIEVLRITEQEQHAISESFDSFLQFTQIRLFTNSILKGGERGVTCNKLSQHALPFDGGTCCWLDGDASEESPSDVPVSDESFWEDGELSISTGELLLGIMLSPLLLMIKKKQQPPSEFFLCRIVW